MAREQNHFRIFAQAVTDVWYAKRPGAIFRENVAYRRWYAVGAAEDEAQRWMAAQDRDEAPRRTAPHPTETPRVESNADRLQRYRQRTDADQSADRRTVPEDVPLDRQTAVDQLQAWSANR